MLPGLTYGKIVSPRIHASINKLVTYSNHTLKVWNVELIESLFYPWEATMITSIIVSEMDDIDTLVWPLTPDGEYSVRSAYRLLESASPQATRVPPP